MNAERGNILFLILLAVVLFAALSYAVTSSMRGGGKNASSESVQAQAADILSWFSQMDAALMRMQLSGNLKPEQISFSYPRLMTDGNTNDYYNNGACTSNTCRVFHVDGGGVALRRFDKYAVPTLSSGSAPGWYEFQLTQWPQTGTSLNDVTISISGVREALCAEINRQLGIAAAPFLGGPWVAMANPANWDNTAFTMTSNGNEAIGKTTYAGALATAPTGDKYCSVVQLLFAR